MTRKYLLQAGAFLSMAFSVQALAGGNQDFIVGGVTVQAGNPIASSTVLIVGEVAAAPTQSVQSTKRKSNETFATADGTEEYICTGSVIAQDMIVTAAHCVADDLNAPTDPSKMWVIFSLDLPKSVQDPSVHTVVNYTYNPGWQGQNASGPDEHDIAVIHFNGALPAGYAPAQLLNPNVALTPGTDVTLAGYGIDAGSDSTGASAGTLREVDGVPVLQLLGQTEVVLDQRSGKGACHGDSGGPAFLPVNGVNYLWGVTNRGYPDDAPDNCIEESVYTRITDYADFINQTMTSLRSQN
jgi:secreted trypsin-like serine protease